MHPLATCKIIWIAWLIGCLGCLSAADFDAVDGPNVRVTRHKDGSRTVFERSPDNRTLTAKTFSGNGVLQSMTVYRMDRHGNPLSCKIYDAQKQELFKASYGYRKADGQLVEERMFDSRVKRTDPDTGREIPVRRFLYTYDAQGRRNKPIAISLVPGKTFDQVYGPGNAPAPGPSALESNPFQEEPAPPPPGSR